MRPAGELADGFDRAFGRAPAGVWAAPGRVNLIGEHTDHNEGFVLPFAIHVGVTCAAGPRGDGLLVARSVQRPDDEVRVPVRSVGPGDVDGWGAYVAGVAWALRESGHDVGGADLLVDGDVPLGAGLASSAALGCAVALALRDLTGTDLDATGLAGTAQRAENAFVGVPTGIMDQLASLHGRAGHALLVDTRSLAITPVPLPLEAAGLSLLVVDTRVRHRLADGAYATRRAECERAARLLGVPALRDVPVEDVDGPAWSALPVVERRRARHVATEDDRVLRCAHLLADGGDPRRIGPLLTASHRSLRDDFEVSAPELDVAVDAALAAGAHGARMVGGGFGGCAIALVDAADAQQVAAAVRAAFARHGYAEPGAMAVDAGDGARRLSPPPP